MCDFVHGPILARTKLFRELKFEPNFNHQKALIADLFWKIKYQFHFHILNCPDIMSTIQNRDRINQRTFLGLAKKYHIYDLQLWNDKLKFNFEPIELDLPCLKSSGIALSPTCTQVNKVLYSL